MSSTFRRSKRVFASTTITNFHPAEFQNWVTARIVLVCLLLLAAFPAALAAAQSPQQLKVKNYTSDFANVLSPATRDQLNALCAELDRKADAQMAIVTIKTLDGRPIEDYSIDLATRLGIGPKQSNRGVMILLAVNDHQYRIEVGYGLEAILPDGRVGGIGREAVPYLRQNNYDAALLLMARRVADVIAADRGVTLSGNPPPAPAAEPQSTTLTPAQIFLILFVIFLVFSFLRRAGGRGSRFNRYGGGGGGWWIGPMMGGMGGGGFGGGGFGGSSGGGGFGGFGGGSFGGGGASGSW